MVTVTNNLNETAAGNGAGKLPSDVSFVDIVRELYSRRRRFGKVFGICVLLTLAITLLWPATYTASSRIMPPQQGQSVANAVLGQLGSLATLATGGKDFGVKNPSDLYVAMLKSRTVADRLIDRYQLKELYNEKTYADAREELEDRSVITAAKDGTISVAVDDRDPARAAQIANGYIEELADLNQKIAITEASQRRSFYERELLQAKNHLADAEVELKKVQEQTGLIALDAQAEMIIESVGSLKARIAAKQVQIRAMSSYATPLNPDLLRAQEELAGMNAELSKLERQKVSGQGDIQVPTGQVPNVGLQYIRRLRDVKYFEGLYEILAKQFELAKLDEAKDIPIVQVLDVAVTPDKRSKPKRALWIGAGVFASLLIATVAVFSDRIRELAALMRTPS